MLGAAGLNRATTQMRRREPDPQWSARSNGHINSAGDYLRLNAAKTWPRSFVDDDAGAARGVGSWLCVTTDQVSGSSAAADPRHSTPSVPDANLVEKRQ